MLHLMMAFDDLILIKDMEHPGKVTN
uniref:Uncharacterized protein n=1 Tax=Rhizophora mucronata TaxID=61149 RepID=A0A2P2IYE4_RHIMU